ncbi:MAG: DUF2934 domain-containing protein [Nitrospirae bacterium]|nr:DUF2934 domain-containing protein [Nitrospirota bacterium]
MKKQSNKKTDSPKSNLSETGAPDRALREQIERKAYELYEKRGWVHGLDIGDWLEAERSVLAETKTETKVRTKTRTKAETDQKTKMPLHGAVSDYQS